MKETNLLAKIARLKQQRAFLKGQALPYAPIKYL